MTRQLSSRFRLTEHADEGGVLLDLKAGEYWQLNSLALSVINQLADGRELAQIIADLQLKHPAEAAAVARDVHRIAAEFREIGALPHE
jgi:hypothetical protein